MQRVIVITGISSGVGKSFIEFVQENLPNDKIIALSHSKITFPLPANVEVIKLTLTDQAEREQAITHILHQYGHIDILINNAGSGLRSTIEDATLQEVNEQFAVNFWPALHLIQLVMPSMRQRKSGHIITVSSLAATLDYPTLGHYGIAKSAIEKASRVLALEVVQWGIHVSVVVPGPIATHFGRNMVESSSVQRSSYAGIYTLWRQKFANLFRHASRSQDVAMLLLRRLDHPRSLTFVRRRDAVAYGLYKILGPRLFSKHMLDIHMG